MAISSFFKNVFFTFKKILSKIFKSRDVDILNGPITKGILTIAFPIMVMNVLASLFNLIDMAVLKQYTHDEYTVGAISACGSLITLITSLISGIFIGTNIVAARSIGEGNFEKVSRTVGTSIFFAIVGGFAFLLIGVCCGKTFLQWSNVSEVLLPKATLYFVLYFLGGPVLVINTCLASILRSTGDSKVTMFSSLASGVIKVGLNFLFVAGFSLGIVGVAVATIISWTVGALWKYIVLIKTNKPTKIKFKYVKFYKNEFKEILFIGAPTALQQSLFAVANVMISIAVNKLGPNATTGVGIANIYDGILYNLCIAPASAVMPFVSQNIGNKNVKRASQSVKSGYLITLVIGVVLGSLSALFSTQLSSILSNTPEVIAYSRQKMIIISSTYFICGFNDIICAAFRGLGRPILPTISALVFLCGLRFIWVFLVFPHFPNLTFLYLVWPIGWLLSLIVLSFFYKPTLNKLKKKFASFLVAETNSALNVSIESADEVATSQETTNEE